MAGEDAVQNLVAELGDVPLIGFAGAPFTLASYLVEGGPSRDYARTKALMWSAPATWDRLMTLLTPVLTLTMALLVGGLIITVMSAILSINELAVQ